MKRDIAKRSPPEIRQKKTAEQMENSSPNPVDSLILGCGRNARRIFWFFYVIIKFYEKRNKVNDEDEKNKLFVDILSKFKPYLESVDFRGDFEINCIVNEKGAYPLEVTARMGTPIVHLHSELHLSPWGEFLYAIANGQKYDLKYKKGFGIVNLIATPPFPYGKKHSKETLYEINIYLDRLNDKEMESLHFEGVSMRVGGKDQGQHFISTDEGYIAYTTAVADTVEKARQESIKIIKKIVIPKAFYRNDIGKDFEQQIPTLKKWGYVK